MPRAISVATPLFDSLPLLNAGEFSKIRRGVMNGNRATRVMSDKQERSDNLNKSLYGAVMELQRDMKTVSLYIKYETVDIQPYFPISSQDLLLEFLSKSDGKYDDRKRQFEHYIAGTATTDPDIESFCNNLQPLLFTLGYIRDTKWPINE